MFNMIRTLFRQARTIADVNTDEFRLSNSNIWTEAHHTDDGGSVQRMRLEDGNVVFISIGIATVKVFVTPLKVTDSAQFIELREFVLTNGLERHSMMTRDERNAEDLLLLNHLRRAIAWPKSIDNLRATLNEMNDTLQVDANA
jgi:hypothetical protein